MKNILDKLVAFLKSMLKWGALTLVPLAVLFVVGEQVESYRLGAIAACESAKDAPNCMRQKGYLAATPFYPDITRRVLGAYARKLGGAFGASYAPPAPPSAED